MLEFPHFLFHVVPNYDCKLAMTKFEAKNIPQYLFSEFSKKKKKNHKNQT